MRKPLSMTVPVGDGIRATVSFKGGDTLLPSHIATLIGYLEIIARGIAAPSPDPERPT
jgi:hypothetical protein